MWLAHFWIDVYATALRAICNPPPMKSLEQWEFERDQRRLAEAVETIRELGFLDDERPKY